MSEARGSFGIASRKSNESWDVFCSVVDNLGDIGFCWRLARCLAALGGRTIRLWVDDLASFQRIEPRVARTDQAQVVGGILIEPWTEAFGQDLLIADVVIQGFGSRLPDGYVRASQFQRKEPVWIHLEYLSGEPWIDEFHGRPSPDPRSGRTTYFFFPGFSPTSGGLLREEGLANQRHEFLQNRLEQEHFWAMLGLAPTTSEELRISLFCYPNAATAPFWEALANDLAHRWTVLVPEGILVPELVDFFGPKAPVLGRPASQGSLTVHRLPFVSQNDYDRLLWSCDVNFVRGEDSFVRAQWAVRPFVWQIYPQDEAVHLKKLLAFWERYTARWPSQAANELKALWLAWNTGASDMGIRFLEFWQARSEWEGEVRRWEEGLASQSDLATRLVHFASGLLK
ncbi:MAG: elongation factor P maturation arginine rhamnosyltransferase EarP [Burkholderiaceae bacterium]